mmetsp:Transcript_11704/g.17714  ORF Transcript_11704/g.17714 Transcript_11704/m.17714 type:complete len:86 (-) Transcript_11704:11-268(-)
MGQSDGQESCQGDSGGPLIISNGEENVQVGIVSWGIGCASKHFPGLPSPQPPPWEGIPSKRNQPTICNAIQFLHRVGRPVSLPCQ